MNCCELFYLKDWKLKRLVISKAYLQAVMIDWLTWIVTLGSERSLDLNDGDELSTNLARLPQNCRKVRWASSMYCGPLFMLWICPSKVTFHEVVQLISLVSLTMWRSIRYFCNGKRYVFYPYVHCSIGESFDLHRTLVSHYSYIWETLISVVIITMYTAEVVADLCLFAAHPVQPVRQK